MKKIISAVVAFSLLCSTGTPVFAQGYEFVKKFENRTITTASSHGSYVVLGRLVKKEIKGKDYLVGASSLYDSTKEKELDLPDNSESEFGKGWNREIIAVNEQGQFLTHIQNFDSAKDHFKINTLDGKSKTIFTHQFEDVWSTHGFNVVLNNAGQVLMRVMESGDTYDGEKVEYYNNSHLYFFDGVKTVELDKHPRTSTECPSLRSEQPHEITEDEMKKRDIELSKCLRKLSETEVASFALNDEGRIAYTEAAEGKFTHYLRETDGQVQRLNTPGLGEYAFVQSFSGNQIAFSGKSGTQVYDLGSEKLQELYPSSSQLIATPLMYKVTNGGFYGDKVIFAAFRKIGERTINSSASGGISFQGTVDVRQTFIGLAELGKEPKYIDCPFAAANLDLLVVAPQPNGNSLIVSEFGPGPSKTDTYVVRPATGSADATPCVVHEGEIAAASAPLPLKNMKRLKSPSKQLSKAKHAELKKKRSKLAKRARR